MNDKLIHHHLFLHLLEVPGTLPMFLAELLLQPVVLLFQIILRLVVGLLLLLLAQELLDPHGFLLVAPRSRLASASPRTPRRHLAAFARGPAIRYGTCSLGPTGC